MSAAIKLSANSKSKLQRLQRAIAKLPQSEQALWKGRVNKLLRSSGTHEWTAEVGADADTHEGESEWDLWLANKLDGAYEVVSDRVVQVAQQGGQAVSTLGFNLWPLAAVALVAWLVTSKK